MSVEDELYRLEKLRKGLRRLLHVDQKLHPRIAKVRAKVAHVEHRLGAMAPPSRE